MRQLAILILILLSCGTTPKRNEFIGEWVAVYNWSGFEKGVGLILNFKNDKEITVSNIGLTKEITFDYQLNRTEIRFLVKDKGTYETFGYFKNVYSDKFTLITPDSSESMEFRRVVETNLRLSAEQAYGTLKNSSWISKRGKDSVRIDFRANHRWDDENQPFEAMFHYWDEKPSKEKETWRLFDYKGKLFLRNTYYQSTDVVHQIMLYDANSIVWTETYDIDRFADLIRKKELTGSENQKLIEALGRNWKSTHIDTTKSNEGGQVRKEDSDILSLDNLKESIEFKFNSNKTYTAKISEQEWKNGVWDITKDGEYIILDDGRYKTNWVQIKQSTDKLILSKLHKFKGGGLGYELYLMTITLE